MKKIYILLLIFFIVLGIFKMPRIMRYSQLRSKQFSKDYQSFYYDYLMQIQNLEKYGKNTAEVSEFINTIGANMNSDNNIIIRNGLGSLTIDNEVQFLSIYGPDGKPSEISILTIQETKEIQSVIFPRLNILDVLFGSRDYVIAYKLTPDIHKKMNCENNDLN